uniref:Uncharacterized protein n=1 Tax=Vespula pensylvanica TaxID=30213 RepID=A0A834NRS2_VESPE|nr:hypothetical protein H0235_011229 [Vespula pensylvanica]
MLPTRFILWPFRRSNDDNDNNDDYDDDEVHKENLYDSVETTEGRITEGMAAFGQFANVLLGTTNATSSLPPPPPPSPSPPPLFTKTYIVKVPLLGLVEEFELINKIIELNGNSNDNNNDDDDDDDDDYDDDKNVLCKLYQAMKQEHPRRFDGDW